MNKPIKPQKPSKRDLPPTRTITVSKLLVRDSNDKLKLIDEISDPLIFSDSTSGQINNELLPDWEHLEDAGYSVDTETLKYSDYKLIAKEVPVDDFEANHQYSVDGYFDCTFISFEIADSHYESKLTQYNNRFTDHEAALAKYNAELDKYDEFTKQQKKEKLQKALKNLE
jgi:hypothetical protein